MLNGTPTRKHRQRPASAAISHGLTDFQVARENARRFHTEAVGKDVNPERCFADFLVSIYRSKDTRQNNPAVSQARATKRLKEYYRSQQVGADIQKTALSVETGGPTGGYLVPQELLDGLMDDLWEESIFRSRALVIPMAVPEVLLPWVDATTAPSTKGVSPWFGGIQFNWMEEAATETETEPTFRQISLQCHDLGGYAIASNNLILDGGRGLEAYLRKLFAASIAWYEDYAFVQGNGAAKPIGILNTPAAISVQRQATALFRASDAAAMYTYLITRTAGSAVWLMHPSVTVVNLPDSSGRSTWVANETGDTIQLYNCQVIVTEKVATAGGLGDVMLVDPALYVIGDRQAVEVDVSFDVKTQYLNNQSAWRVIERIDGQPWLNNYVTLQDTTTKVTGYVLLQ